MSIARDTVIQEMQQGYEECGIATEHLGDKFCLCINGEKYSLDINQAWELQQRLLDFEVETKPHPTSIATSEYREQLLQITGTRNRTARAFSLREPIVIRDDKSNIEITIGLATPLYYHRFRFEREITNRLRGMIRYANDPLDVYKAEDLAFPKQVTIRLSGFRCNSVAECISKTDQIIDTCLFDIAYNTGMTLVPKAEWNNPEERRIAPRFMKYSRDRALPFRDVAVDRDALRFYLFATSSDEPVFAFLAYYQVLERFFIDVSDRRLHVKLERQLLNPDFRVTTTHIRDLAQQVFSHSREYDETEMLKSVLEEYVDPIDLANIIREYETWIGSYHYTKEREFWGYKGRVNLDSGHILGNVATRIKAIRNALVHSTDRHEFASRHVPYTSDSSLVGTELPIIKYIAERVIIATSTPRQ